jgi:Flp pilus assembly protein TadB
VNNTSFENAKSNEVEGSFLLGNGAASLGIGFLTLRKMECFLFKGLELRDTLRHTEIKAFGSSNRLSPIAQGRRDKSLKNEVHRISFTQNCSYSNSYEMYFIVSATDILLLLLLILLLVLLLLLLLVLLLVLLLLLLLVY